MNKISENFQGNETKNRIYKQILQDLGLKASTDMKVGELARAMELVDEYAKKENRVDDEVPKQDIVEPATKEKLNEDEQPS
jgi:hypothetical protein